MTAFLSNTTTKDRTTMNFRFAPIASLIAIALLAATLSAGAPVANAGSYNVYQCHTAHGGGHSSGWVPGYNGFPYGISGCAGGWFNMTATGKGPGQYLWWSTTTRVPHQDPSPLLKG